jgi:hypothetical protein
MTSRPAIAALALLAIWAIPPEGSFIFASPIKHQDNCREKAINDTLNATLVVGLDMRAQGKKATWDEISQEVARRMKIQRREPWK